DATNLAEPVPWDRPREVRDAFGSFSRTPRTVRHPRSSGLVTDARIGPRRTLGWARSQRPSGIEWSAVRPPVGSRDRLAVEHDEDRAIALGSLAAQDDAGLA